MLLDALSAYANFPEVSSSVFITQNTNIVTFFRVPVILQPKCFPPPAADSRPANKTRREVAEDNDLWVEFEDADWGEPTSACAAAGQFPDLSLTALQRLPELAKLLSEEAFSPDLGKKGENL